MSTPLSRPVVFATIEERINQICNINDKFDVSKSFLEVQPITINEFIFECQNKSDNNVYRNIDILLANIDWWINRYKIGNHSAYSLNTPVAIDNIVLTLQNSNEENVLRIEDQTSIIHTIASKEKIDDIIVTLQRMKAYLAQ